uniref:Uncharacterized protein n=2 Tax=Cajanus cajan TaxID=3821 RepID=A0A151TT99_CAJCA|nr:hypothetical protein KK1_009489 [Cajanus cajan]
MASLPLHGACSNKPLRFQAHSMVQKSSHFSFKGFGSTLGHHRGSRLLIDQQPGICHKSSRGSVGRFDVVKTMTNSETNEEISGYLVSGITRLKTNQEGTKHLDLSLKL